MKFAREGATPLIKMSVQEPENVNRGFKYEIGFSDGFK